MLVRDTGWVVAGRRIRQPNLDDPVGVVSFKRSTCEWLCPTGVSDARVVLGVVAVARGNSSRRMSISLTFWGGLAVCARFLLALIRGFILGLLVDL